MKDNLKKFIDDPIFQSGLLKWLSKINQAFSNTTSLEDIIEKDQLIHIIELTFFNK